MTLKGQISYFSVLNALYLVMQNSLNIDFDFCTKYIQLKEAYYGLLEMRIALHTTVINNNSNKKLWIHSKQGTRGIKDNTFSQLVL